MKSNHKHTIATTEGHMIHAFDFKRIESAKSMAYIHNTYPMRVVCKDNIYYVVCPADAERLMRHGYTMINR